MEFLLPFVPASSSGQSPVMASRGRPNPNLTIGLVDNGKPHAHELLVEIGDALVRRGVGGSHFMVRKPNAGKPMTEEERADMLARVHLVVCGVGA
jgi:hypothetical protein